MKNARRIGLTAGLGFLLVAGFSQKIIADSNQDAIMRKNEVDVLKVEVSKIMPSAGHDMSMKKCGYAAQKFDVDESYDFSKDGCSAKEIAYALWVHDAGNK